MSMKTVLAVIGLVVAIASVSPLAVAQVKGPFIGASFGQSTARETCTSAVAAGTTCDKQDTAIGVFVGHQIDKFSAIEVGYYDLGKFSASGAGGTTTTELKGFELSGVGSLPLGARFSLFGKFGVFRWNLEQSSAGTGGNFSQSKTGTDVTYGFGMRFNLTNSFALRAQYQRYRDIGDGTTGGKSEFDAISAAAIFSF